MEEKGRNVTEEEAIVYYIVCKLFKAKNNLCTIFLLCRKKV